MTDDRSYKKSHPEPKGGWTKDDRTVRCITCGHGKDESGAMIGTPLSRITIKVSYPYAPYTPIALAGICRRCHRLYKTKLLPAAAELEISQDNIESLMRATKNGDSFTLPELYSGKMEEPVFSEALQEIFARHKHLAPAPMNERTGLYDPNKLTEQQFPLPEPEEVPL